MEDNKLSSFVHASNRASFFCLYDVFIVLQVQNMTSNKKSSLKDAALAALTDEKVFKKVTLLFASCNVTLLKEKDSVVTKISNPQDRLPLMLCIAVKGLASLVPPVWLEYNSKAKISDVRWGPKGT